MGLPVTVFRWDDAGAPQLVDRRPSEIIEILKKCLVDGYGTKQPLGWTVSFEDQLTRKVVFRNSTTDGSGGVLRFADHYEDDRVSGLLRFTHGKIANSIDEILPLHVYGVVGSLVATANKWVVIGTSRSFYLIITRSDLPMASGTNSGFGTWWFGDFDPSLPYDQNTMGARYINANGNSTGLSWSETLDYTTHATQFAKLYDANNDVHVANYILNLNLAGNGGYSQSSSLGSKGVPIANLFLAPVTIRLQTLGADTKDAFDIPLKLSESRPVIRGAMPGLYEFAQGGYSDQPWPQIRNQGGRNYWIIKQAHVGSCNVCIDMDTWYE